jgi:hypothetical protein
MVLLCKRLSCQAPSIGAIMPVAAFRDILDDVLGAQWPLSSPSTNAVHWGDLRCVRSKHKFLNHGAPRQAATRSVMSRCRCYLVLIITSDAQFARQM